MSQLFFILLLLIGLVLGAVSIFSSLLYDLSMAKTNKEAAAHPYSKALRKRPKVSVLVIAGNNPKQLQNCLHNITKSKYRKYEIIIATQNLSLVRKTVSDFKKKYRSKKIKVVKISNNYWQEAAKKIKDPGVSIVIQDNYLLDSSAISETVVYFALNQNHEVLTAHVTNIFNYSITGLIHEYEFMIKNQWQKTLSVLHKNKAQYDGFTAFRSQVKNISQAQYCSNIKVYNDGTSPVPKNKNNLSKLLLLATLLTVSYALFVALNLHYNALIAIIWLGFLLFLALNIWSEEHLSLKQKIRMLALAPMASLLFYLTIIFRIFR
jgi:hypothetical protein